MKGFIIYPTYKVLNGKAQVMLFGRLDNGESFVTIHDFKPYFWIKSSDKKKAEEIIKEIQAKSITIEDSDFHNFDNERVCKVVLSIPKEVPELKKLFQEKGIICHEADIRFSYRFMFDYNIKACMEIKGNYRKPNEKEGLFVDRVYENPEISSAEFWPSLNVLSIDIETALKDSKVFCIALKSKEINKVLIAKDGSYNNADTFKTEKEMLEKFQKLLIEFNPDVITGWNLLDFDFLVLKERFKKYNIPFILGRTNEECSLRITDSFFIDSSANFHGRAVIDAIHLIKVSFLRLDDYKLNTVAKTILGEEKLITAGDRSKEIEELYEKNPQKLIDYNLKDAELVMKILEKTNVLNLSIKRSIITGMQLDRVQASIASLDSLYLRELKARKIVAPSAFIDENDERIKGGYVMQSKPGIYKGIIVLDFKSLYPSIIGTFNIDPYSFVPQEKYSSMSEKEKSSLIEAPNKAHFKNQEGILPIIIQHLWEQRDLAKKQNNALESQAIKILMNSFFGVLANPTCRFFSLEMANAITHFGQFFNKLTAEKIKEKGFDVIYGDTDSLFINTNTEDIKKAEATGKEIQGYINNFYKKYVPEKYARTSYLEIQFDKAFKKFLMPKIRGAEIGAKKRYAGLIERNGKEEIIFTGLEFVRRDWTELSKKFQMELLDNIFHEKPVSDYIKKFVNDLKAGKMDSLLVYKKAIRKGVSEYTKTTPPHIKAARKLGRELPGFIEYVMTVNGPEPLEKNHSKIDYEHYIDKQIMPIADSILSFQDKNFLDIISKQKQTDLSSFR